MNRLGLIVCTPTLAVALAACGGGTTEPPADAGTTPPDSGEVIEPDSGVVVVPDAGPADTGPRDCSGNPFRCAPMQQMDAECICLESCEGDLRWNPATGMCEEPPRGECTTSSDCQTDQACLNAPQAGGLQPCNGEDTCRCFLECDPWVRFPQSGCPPSLDFGGGQTAVDCTWLGTADLPPALCLPQGTGGEQAAACTDPMQCNRQKNFFCAGRTTNETTGGCARICDSTKPDDVCTDLGTYTCVDFADPNLPGLGFCAEAPAMDIGTTCTSSTTCTGELCSQILAGSCSQAFGGGLSLFPPEALFISFTAGAPVGEEDICMSRCSGADAMGDMECAARNPNTICRDLLTMGPSLCAPPCTTGVGCAPPAMCDPVSGRCQ